MPSPDRRPIRNRLLRALPPEDFGLLWPHLDRVPLDKGEVVIHPDQPFEYAYFPEGGLASVVCLTDGGQRLEVGMLGREGMLPTGLVLGTDRTPLETLCQGEGNWLRIGTDPLRRVMEQSPALRGVLMLYIQTFLLTVGQTALANGFYKTEERLARWLLMSHDRLDGDELPLTHEFLSVMLGVHRPGVTVALHILEGAGMIRAKRGLITVLDRGKLREAAGNSYGPAEAEYERLIGPLRERGAGAAGDGPRDASE